MKICGIICEFNPLHNGHLYIIEKAKIQGYHVLCLMSGNFTQRGTPTILDKFSRAELAIRAGATAVIELPFIYAVNSADQFAAGAIKILKALNVDSIMFGSECGNKETLEKIANMQLHETQEFKRKLKEKLKLGVNFNDAYKSAMSDITNDKSVLSAISSSNDILGIAYMKEIIKQKANIVCHVIKRTDNGYNSSTPENKFLSASAICDKVKVGQEIQHFVPQYTKTMLENNSLFNYSSYMSILTYNIVNENYKNLNRIFGISEGLEYLIKNKIENHTEYEKFRNSLVSRRYRQTRIDKQLIYIALNLTKKQYKKAIKTPLTLNVLAVNKNNKDILSYLSKNKVKLIVRHKDYDKLNNKNKTSLNIDKLANTLYSICTNAPIEKSKLMGAKFV